MHELIARSFLGIGNTQRVRQSWEGILSLEAGTDQQPLFLVPVCNAAKICCLFAVLDEKGNKSCSEGIP